MSGPGFESGFLHNDPDALQDNCVILGIGIGIGIYIF